MASPGALDDTPHAALVEPAARLDGDVQPRRRRGARPPAAADPSGAALVRSFVLPSKDLSDNFSTSKTK